MILVAGAPSGVFSLISHLSNGISYIFAADTVDNLTNKEYQQKYFLHSYF